MGIRFRKSFKVAPGVKVNVNKKSVGVTVGEKGIHHTVNSSGRKTSSVGIPGTGMYYQNISGGGKSSGDSSKSPYGSSANTGNNKTPKNNKNKNKSNISYDIEHNQVLIGKSPFTPKQLQTYSNIFIVISSLIAIIATFIMPVGILFLALAGLTFNVALKYKNYLHEFQQQKILSDNIIKSATDDGYILNGEAPAISKKSPSIPFIILCVVIPLFGIIYLWTCKKDMMKGKKWIFTIALGLLLLISIGAFSSTSKTTKNENEPPSESIASEHETETDTTENTSESTEQVEETEQQATEAPVTATEPITEVKTEAPVIVQTEQATQAPTEAPTTAEKTYIINTSTGVFHKPTCRTVKNMNESNKLSLTSTYDNLTQQGYKPCGVCNPN